ncbi:LysR family transcriptional regulator [Ramlibacter sp. AW1]|uniref:LysR family transcriptional regulator n=1 Tax=Ramlibacter aurantiacus TaxID=2801330 RepID=A0A936ZGN5_9BURK|nr:LysR family transcriptional regulator [Ramlibacter aurantiacus]MBL0420582.1 LysR family transcriptional regulator [Ramlibacter aurantiacus]
MDFDLNLLKVLAAVARTRSVTLAADELGLSQPGVSSALARLRAVTGDPLFVRTGKGMEPTPRAQDLLGSAQDLLAKIGQAVRAGAAFDPATTPTVFRLALSDVGEMSVLPALLNDLRASAPQATVQTVSLPPGELRATLEDGSVDLAVGYMPELGGAGLYQQQLYTHGFCCLLRADHPVQSARIGRRDYEKLEHVVVRSPVRSQELIDREIDRSGIRRRVVLHTPHYLSLPVIVSRTDLIATVPQAVGTAFVEMGLLRKARPPVPSPRFPVRQHWHARFHADPRHQWLRERMRALFTTRS